MNAFKQNNGCGIELIGDYLSFQVNTREKIFI